MNVNRLILVLVIVLSVSVSQADELIFETVVPTQELLFEDISSQKITPTKPVEIEPKELTFDSLIPSGTISIDGESMRGDILINLPGVQRIKQTRGGRTVEASKIQVYGGHVERLTINHRLIYSCTVLKNGDRNCFSY